MTAPIFATKHPTLYREFSSENFDYYGITDEKLCPLCELEHGDEESIEGSYKAESYFIKCEQRKIEIVAQSGHFVTTFAARKASGAERLGERQGKII